ncbi:growth arrest-specific protein 1a [Festucalex cinctus]
MVTFGALAPSLRCSLGPLTCVLLLATLSAASPTHGRRLVCWQAILSCQAERECNYAYEHYLRACAPVLNGERKKCPSHCISSLVQLNLTRNGPALEDCSCGHDAFCTRTKRAIEPCLPRTTSSGCTAARVQCQRDQQCSSTMSDYMKHCGHLFSSSVCTDACRKVIDKMRKIPKGQQLDTCMCDGDERTICEVVKSRMRQGCFDAPEPEESSGVSHDGYDAEDDEDYADSDYRLEAESGASRVDVRCVRSLLLASILALTPLF